MSAPQNSWNRVGEDFSIYEFKLEEPFIGTFVETKEIIPQDKKKSKFNLHVFAETETGEVHNLPDVYAVQKAIASVENPTDTAFKFVFKGKKDLGRGRSVNMIDAFTMPLASL